MANRRPFGRRTDQQPRFYQPTGERDVAASRVTAEPIPVFPPPSPEVPAPSPDEELLAWTRARRQNYRIPWRQLSLMASLCFGVASFVLPDSVNDSLQWLLYALAAASFCGGFIKRREPGR